MPNFLLIVRVSLKPQTMNSNKKYLNSVFIYLTLGLLALQSCHDTHQNVEMAGPDEYYTCSMDPQVIENKSGNCPICHMKLIKVNRNNLEPGQIKLSSQQIKFGNITFDTIRSHELSNEITITGKVAVDQNFTSAISSKVQGRIEKLFIRNIGDYISKGQILYEIYSEDLNATQEEYLLSLQQSVSENFKEAVKNKLLLYGMSESQIIQLKSSKKALPYIPVFSTQDGFISEIFISEGNYVASGATLFRVATFESLWIEAQVYMPFLPYLKIGTEAAFSIPAAGEQKFSGKVIFIDPQLQTLSRFVLARFQILNPSQIIKPGMMANITLQTEKIKSLALPIDAIIQDSKGANVWVLNSDGVFENRMVVIGMQNSREVEIMDGIKEGEVVVVTGAYLINSEYIFKKGANPMEGHTGHGGMKM